MLDTVTAENAVVALLDDLAARTANPAQARQDFARQLVSIMATMVRSGTVTASTTVITAGSATTQTGPVTITNGKIS